MLSDQEIYKCLNENEITVDYYFLPKENNDFFVQRTIIEDEDTLQKIKKKFLQSNIGRNRLGITLGALINNIDGKQVNKKYRWNGYKHIHDLRKGEYLLQPRSTVVALSNEFIKTNKNHTAIILSRVSHFSRGLTIHPTYIQSLWEGILKLQITNLSDSNIKLKLGDEIGGIFFFYSNIDESAGISKEIDSHHYRLRWDRLIGENSINFNPFSDIIQEKEILHFLKRSLRNIKDNWSFYFGRVGLITLISTILLYLFSSMNTLTNKVPDQNINGQVALNDTITLIKEPIPESWRNKSGLLITNNDRLVESYFFSKENNKFYVNIKLNGKNKEVFKWILIPNH